ncbi:Lipid-A-disaccharide [Musa troglodytarum]|uniref:lipid-A-disaccharide synthase n=1 Tax=Musa troglodytarum TaxID=320322 RepID=A0A9E7KP40_9LILI|nr:Lipid-A-disaccharide [Musa troglodytarum]
MLLRPIGGQPDGGLGGRLFVSWRIASKSGLSSYTTADSSGKRIIDMAAREGELRVFMVAGEVSGDSIASRLMASLKKLSPFPVRFAGVGGSLMSKEGLQTIFPMEEIAVMGLWELLPHLNTFRKRLKETTEAAFLFRPHAVVTVDSKGFSFRLLKRLKAVIELQLARLPCVVAYRAHLLTEWVIRYRTKLNFISLPNILLNSDIIPEVLFRECTPGKLATVFSKVVLDNNIQEKQTSAAEKVLQLLCPPREDTYRLLLEKLGYTGAHQAFSLQKSNDGDRDWDQVLFQERLKMSLLENCLAAPYEVFMINMAIANLMCPERANLEFVRFALMWSHIYPLGGHNGSDWVRVGLSCQWGIDVAPSQRSHVEDNDTALQVSRLTTPPLITAHARGAISDVRVARSRNDSNRSHQIALGTRSGERKGVDVILRNKKGERAETFEYWKSKEEITKEFEEKKADLQPKVARPPEVAEEIKKEEEAEKVSKQGLKATLLPLS